MTTAPIAALTALLTVAGIIGPQTRVTPPIINPALDLIGCVAQNLGGHPIAVEADLHNHEGTVVQSAMQMVPAGRAVEIAAASLPSGYCTFRFDDDPETLRAFVRLRGPSGETLALFPSFHRRGAAAGAWLTVTPPLRSLGDGNLACVVQNVAAATLEVDTELLDADGTVVDSATDQMAPGTLRQTITTGDDHLGAYCRFAASEGGDHLRGYVALLGAASVHLLLPATSPDSVGTTASTPPISSREGDATICAVQNLDAAVLNVAAEIVDATGTVIDDGDVMVPPGDVEVIAGHTEGGDSMVCRFAFANPAAQGRAFVTRFPSGLFRDTDLLVIAEKPDGDAQDDVTTYGPPIGVGSEGALECAALNQTNAPINVHYAITGGDGANLAGVDGAVPANRGQNALSVDEVDDAVCSFTFDGSPGRLRGYSTLRNDDADRTLQVFAAVPPGPSPTPTATSRPTFTATPTRTHSETPTLTSTRTATATVTATDTPVATATHTATRTATGTATRTPTATLAPTASHTATASPTATLEASPTATDTPIATATHTATRTASATATRTLTATQTASHTATAPPTATLEASATATTALEASATPTATATATATGTGAPACDGDCNGDGTVTIDELITQVNIALGAPLAACPAGDRNDDGAISIDELIVAVTNALGGCPG